MKKIHIRIVAALLAASLGLTFTVSAFAAEKEEVIYVLANADGSIDKAYAVNSFDGGSITDYGEYADLKLLNIDGKITRDNGKISFSSPYNQKVYYQGTLKNTEIPWDISIRFFLEGKELSAEEIAGKSGCLEIKINVSENENCPKDFYENYALQCSFTLDTEICKNITAEGATVANVGSKKQITYTALAGNGLDRSILADVTNFEMPSAQINGIRMNLGLDIDFDGDISELMDGARELDDGAKELSDGVTDLNEGIEKLRDGIDKANEGLAELNEKSSGLTKGSAEIKKALITIQSSLTEVSTSADKLQQLTVASTQIKSGIESLYTGISELKNSVSFENYKAAMGINGLDIDKLKAGNQQAIEQLTAQIDELKITLDQIKNIPEYAQQAAELTAQITQLETIVQLLSGNNAMIGGTEMYLNTVSGAVIQLEAGAKELKVKYVEFDKAINELSVSLGEMLVDMSKLSGGIDTLVREYEKLDSGIVEYTDGVGKLYEGYEKISDGTKELAEGGIALADGTKKLKDGTGQLWEKTNVFDGDSSEKLTTMLDNMTKEYETVSFVSDKNRDVSSVQFVIKTGAVEIHEPEVPTEEAEEKLNFWQKLLRLFGLY